MRPETMAQPETRYSLHRLRCSHCRLSVAERAGERYTRNPCPIERALEYRLQDFRHWGNGYRMWGTVDFRYL